MSQESSERAAHNGTSNPQPQPRPSLTSGDSGRQSSRRRRDSQTRRSSQNRRDSPNPEDRFEIDNVPLRDAAMIVPRGSEGHMITPGQTNAWQPLPALHTPHKKRKTILIVGSIIIAVDLCALPIAYYYAMRYDTNLSLQIIFAIITGIYGLFAFTHYAFRSFKLFRTKTQPRWRPIGWTKWGLAEFFHVNLLIIIILFEIELVAGTIPHHPLVRLIAMVPATIFFYVGFLFIISAILTKMRHPLPFNMSSTPKGTPWRPALLAFIEDVGAIEGRGGVEYRKAVIKRYEASPRFRRLILILSWFWGLGLICTAIASTVLIMMLSEDVGFGVGWGMPWVWALFWIALTMVFVKRELKIEKAEWRAKEELSGRAPAV